MAYSPYSHFSSPTTPYVVQPPLYPPSDGSLNLTRIGFGTSGSTGSTGKASAPVGPR